MIDAYANAGHLRAYNTPRHSIQSSAYCTYFESIVFRNLRGLWERVTSHRGGFFTFGNHSLPPKNGIRISEHRKEPRRVYQFATKRSAMKFIEHFTVRSFGNAKPPTPSVHHPERSGAASENRQRNRQHEETSCHDRCLSHGRCILGIRDSSKRSLNVSSLIQSRGIRENAPEVSWNNHCQCVHLLCLLLFRRHRTRQLRELER